MAIARTLNEPATKLFVSHRLAALCGSLSIALIFYVAAADARPALPGQECQTTAVSTWLDSEKWAWGRICEDKVANFNERFGAVLDPAADGWTRDRRITSPFLETILLHDPYRSALGRRGVRIVGAWFDQRVSLGDASIEHSLWLEASRFEQDVSLRRLVTSRLIALNRSTIVGALDLRSSVVARGLFLSNGRFGGLNLSNARIGARTSMSSSVFEEDVNMASIQVAGDLFMRTGASFKNLTLTSARIDGFLSLSESTIGGKLDMSAAEIRGNVYLRGQFEDDVLLRGLDVGGAVSLSGARFADELDLSGTTIGGSVFMSDSELPDVMLARYLDVAGNFDMSNGRFKAVDLSSSQIDGQLRLGSKLNEPPNWRGESRLVLRAASVGELQDRFVEGHDSWPRQLELEGFDYDRLGGIAGEASHRDLVTRDAEWFIDLLARDESFSPGAYTQLANVLRASGQKTKADDVLFAGKERERSLASGLPWFGFTLLSYTTGYGYHYFYSLFWVIVLVIIGTAVLKHFKESARHDISIAYSLDMLLPIIRLRDRHYSIDLESPARYYFYAHKVMGYVLASFLLAGLAGLTK